jgi:hypothetical protein
MTVQVLRGDTMCSQQEKGPFYTPQQLLRYCFTYHVSFADNVHS